MCRTMGKEGRRKTIIITISRLLIKLRIRSFREIKFNNTGNRKWGSRANLFMRRWKTDDERNG